MTVLISYMWKTVSVLCFLEEATMLNFRVCNVWGVWRWGTASVSSTHLTSLLETSSFYRTPPTPGTALCNFATLYASGDAPPTSLCRVSSTWLLIFRCMPSLLSRKITQTASVIQTCIRRPSPCVHWVGISKYGLTRLLMGSLSLRPHLCQLGTYDSRLLERRSLELPRRTDNSLGGTLTRKINNCYCIQTQ